MSKAVWFECASGSLSACDVGVPWYGGKGGGLSTVAACGCCDGLLQLPLPLLRGSLLVAVAGYKQFASKRRQAPHVGRVSSHCRYGVSVHPKLQVTGMCRCTLRCFCLHSRQPWRDLTWARLWRFAHVSDAVDIVESSPCSAVPMYVSRRCTVISHWGRKRRRAIRVFMKLERREAALGLAQARVFSDMKLVVWVVVPWSTVAGGSTLVSFNSHRIRDLSFSPADMPQRPRHCHIEAQPIIWTKGPYQRPLKLLCMLKRGQAELNSVHSTRLPL